MNQNKHNSPITSPELAALPATSLVDTIKLDQSFSAEVVGKEAMSFAADTPMAPTEAYNQEMGISQQLHGIIRAGSETFGLVKVASEGKQGAPTGEQFILTKFDTEGKRATLVGSIAEGKPLEVGRKHQKNLNEDVSREHFTVAFVDGKLIIGEHGQTATNGTELIRARDQDATTAPLQHKKFGLSALRRFKSRTKTGGQESASASTAMLENFSLWSASTAAVKSELQRTRIPTTADVPREPSIGSFDPVAKHEIIEPNLKDGVSIRDMMAETEGKQATLNISTGEGNITLEKVEEPGFDGFFRVSSSDDPSMKIGQYVRPDGVTPNGVGFKPGVIAPNLRMAFTRMYRKVLTLGVENTATTATQELIDQYKEKAPHILEQISPTEYLFKVADPKVRATGFVAHANLLLMDDQGVEQKQLF